MKIFIALLSILSVLNIITAEDEVEPENSSISTIDYIKDIDNSFLIGPQKDVVLVFGNTGSGKTTLTSLLTNSELESIEKDGKFLVIDKNDKINGNDRKKSKTIIPDLMINGENGVALYDCPGFNDFKDANEDLAATFAIRKLLNSVESVKIVFTTTIEGFDFYMLFKYITDLIKDIEKYRDSIALVYTRMPNTIAKSNIGWPFGGGQLLPIDETAAIEAFAKFLEKSKEGLASKLTKMKEGDDGRQFIERAIQLIDIFLEKNENGYAKIGVVQVPEKAGPLSELTAIQNEKSTIMKVINENLKFVQKQDNDFRYTVSNKTKSYVDETVVNELKTKLNTDFTPIVSNINRFRVEKEKLNSNSLNDSIITAAMINKKLSQIRSTKPEEFKKQLTDAIDELGFNLTPADLKQFNDDIEYLDFLQVISDNSLTIPSEILDQIVQQRRHLNNAQMWYFFLVLVREKLSEYSVQQQPSEYDGSGVMNLSIDENAEKTVSELGLESTVNLIDPELYDNLQNVQVNAFKLNLLQRIWSQSMQRPSKECSSDGKRLIVKGYDILISDVIQAECLPSVNHIEIFALNKVFFDADIDKASTYLSIISPRWEIIPDAETSSRSIKLNGFDGVNFNTTAKDGVSEVDLSDHGSPGFPGGPGGQFFGIGQSTNDIKLEIYANGGRGGDGQDGGKGSKGSKGYEIPEKIDINYVLAWKTPCGNKTNEMIDGNFVETEKYCGKPGGRATEGGNGGCKGVGGVRGDVKIKFGLEKQPNIAIFNENGESGKDGKGGLGGEGGENGRTFVVKVHNRGIKNFTSIWQIFKPIIKTEKWYEDAGRQPDGEKGLDGGNCYEIKPTAFDFYDSSQSMNDYKNYAKEYLAKNVQMLDLSEFLEYLDTENTNRN